VHLFNFVILRIPFPCRTLQCTERNKTLVATPVRIDQLVNALPAIKGVWGMAVRQQSDDIRWEVLAPSSNE
jgi:hypothetical protein